MRTRDEFRRLRDTEPPELRAPVTNQYLAAYHTARRI